MRLVSLLVLSTLVLAGPALCAEAEASPSAAPPWLRLHSAWDASPGHFRRLSSPSVPGDELWGDQFGLPSIDGVVNCAVEFEGGLVVGGWIRQAGGVLTNHIARWDGSRWSPLASGTDGPVTALAVFQGDLIAGGYFQHAGDVFARGVARWDGETWEAMGAGLHDSLTNPSLISALTAYGGSLIAGGEFTHSGGTLVNFIAQWDGTAWTPMGAGFDNPVLALAATTDSLYAGGRFSHSGGTPVSLLARWDGDSWQEVGGGVRSERVSALAVNGTRLIVGGHFDQAGSHLVTNIATWDGVNWDEMAGGTYGYTITALAVKDGTLFTHAGELLSWNGYEWTTHPGLHGEAYTIAVGGESLFVGGFLQLDDDLGRALAFTIARYSDGAWYELEPWGVDMHGLSYGWNGAGHVATLTTFRGHVVAGGWFQYVGAPPDWAGVNGLAEWLGDGWHPLPSIPHEGFPLVSLGQQDTLYAGGFSQYGFTNVPVYRFANSEWTPLGTCACMPRVMLQYRGALHTAGGGVGLNDSTSIVNRWDGSQWVSVGTVKADAQFALIESMVELDGRLIIGGRFSSVDGIPALNIAAWDGSRWEQFGTGLRGLGGLGWVNGLTVHDGALIAGGLFNVPGALDKRVVRWTGSGWEPVGDVRGYPAVPTSAGGELFLSGFFYVSDDYDEAGTLARWDGTSWVPLGSGPNGPVNAFLEHDGAIYMGGGFSWAGGKSSFGIARWDGLARPVNTPALLPAAPNPFRSSTAFSYSLPTDGAVRISVFDSRGREVAILENGVRTNGPHTVTWNGRGKSGQALPGGVYFIRAALPGAVLSRKVVRLR